LKAAQDIAPVFLFPMDNTEIAISNMGDPGESIDLLVQASGSQTRVYVDSRPIEKTRHGYQFVPPSEGFYNLKVVDVAGHETKSRFRVLSTKNLEHPGL